MINTRRSRYIALSTNDNDSNQIAMVIPSTRKGHAGSRDNFANSNHHGDEIVHRLNNGRRSEVDEVKPDLVSGAGDTVIKLNIGGTSFRIRVTSIFARSADEKLSAFAQLNHEQRLQSCDAFLMPQEEYYFERSAVLFDSIFKYYISGQLHRPLDICPTEFSTELAYWKINDGLMSNCCWRGYNMSASLEELVAPKEKKIELHDRSLRSRIHQFCEGDGSLFSTLFTFGSITFVLISVIGLVLGSIHELQVPIYKKGGKSERINNWTMVENENVIWEPHPIFGYVETICIIWFTVEFIVRLAVTPNRFQFLVGIMNIVDMIAIIPFYLELGLALFGIDVASLSDIKGALLVVRVLRVLRVVRILKLGRYSSGMRTFALTLKSSARQLGMMGMVLSTGVVFFSTLLYFVEKDEKDTPFTSIPAAFWWAIVTMTTVGYGDYVPVTVPGKLIASGAIISGVLVLALPITIIVDNFMKVSGNVNANIFSSAQQRPIDVEQ
ncbi:CBN-KVS-1 protein [Caenorhabditis brenneri]|uniref:CBN-KVS-1 protein n=1 Tax=Caenorhabditis brenneri TaxID=135651 RepID=G0MWJ7_CAEBE|nr:CBN-KVS-1 protein [Caenorhabditis brenneri]